MALQKLLVVNNGLFGFNLKGGSGSASLGANLVFGALRLGFFQVLVRLLEIAMIVDVLLLDLAFSVIAFREIALVIIINFLETLGVRLRDCFAICTLLFIRKTKT